MYANAFAPLQAWHLFFYKETAGYFFIYTDAEPFPVFCTVYPGKS